MLVGRAIALVLEQRLQLVGPLLAVVREPNERVSVFLPSLEVPPAALTAATLCAT